MGIVNKLLCKYFDSNKNGYVTVRDIAGVAL